MAKGSHGDVLDQIGHRIVLGEPAPGEVITVADLEAEYSVSRTVVREAVRVLESIGMVRSKRRVGLTVLPRECWDSFDAHLIQWNLTGPGRQAQLESLIELRLAVEPVAARLAARRASADESAELVRLSDTLDTLGQQKLGNSDQYLEVDVAFHSLLLASSGNPMFRTLTKPICEILRGRSALGLTPAVPAPSVLADHLGAALAIQRGESEAAEMHVRGYVASIWQEVIRDPQPVVSP